MKHLIIMLCMIGLGASIVHADTFISSPFSHSIGCSVNGKLVSKPSDLHTSIDGYVTFDHPTKTLSNIDCSAKVPATLRPQANEIPFCPMMLKDPDNFTYYGGIVGTSKCTNSQIRDNGVAQCRYTYSGRDMIFDPNYIKNGVVERKPDGTLPIIGNKDAVADFYCEVDWQDTTHTPCPTPPPDKNAIIMIAEDDDSQDACAGLALENALKNTFPFNQVSIGLTHLSDDIMRCRVGDYDILVCDDAAIHQALQAPIPIVITKMAGRGNFGDGVVHLWIDGSDVGTTSHELGHMIAGFGDEYKPDPPTQPPAPGQLTEQQFYCRQNQQYPNIHYFPSRGSYDNATVQTLLSQVPWASFIAPGSPLTHNNQLGADPQNASYSTVGLFGNDRCSSPFDPPLDAVTPHFNSFMNNPNLPIPPYHMYVLVKAMNAYLGTNITPPNPLGSTSNPTATPCSSPKPSPSPSPTASCTPSPKST